MTSTVGRLLKGVRDFRSLVLIARERFSRSHQAWCLTFVVLEEGRSDSDLCLSCTYIRVMVSVRCTRLGGFIPDQICVPWRVEGLKAANKPPKNLRRRGAVDMSPRQRTNDALLTPLGSKHPPNPKQHPFLPFFLPRARLLGCSLLRPRPLRRLVGSQGPSKHFLRGLRRLGPRFRVRVEHSPVKHQLHRLTEALVAICFRQGGQPVHPVVFEQFTGAGLSFFAGIVLVVSQEGGYVGGVRARTGQGGGVEGIQLLLFLGYLIADHASLSRH